MRRLTLLSLPLWVLCTLLFVGWELAPALAWVCMCLTTGGGGECWQDWTHHYTVGDDWGSDLRHLVGQNQNLQVSPLFAPVPWWLCSSSILCKEEPCAVASCHCRDWIIGRICREKNRVLQNPVSVRWSLELCISQHWAHMRSGVGNP